MDAEVLKKYKEAGRIASEALMYGKSLMKVGSSCMEVLDSVESFIQKNGAKPAFPAQISINEVAAHFCPTKEENPVFKEGDIASLDIGVHVDGYIGDNAVTVDFNSEYGDIIKASREAVKAAINVVQPGITTGEVGKAIQETINSFNLNPVRNLTGHGLGFFDIHTKPTIPNFDSGSDVKLEENQVIAIEPFATNGDGRIHEKGRATVFSLMKLKNVRNPYSREVLKFIADNYQTLPFTTRWLVEKFGEGKTRIALADLERQEIIHAYPPLPEVSNGIVSQCEVSCIVKDTPIVTTTSETNWKDH